MRISLREVSINPKFYLVLLSDHNLIPQNWYIFRWMCARTHAHTYIYVQECTIPGRSFQKIFMKFTWSVRVHPWGNPICFYKQSAQQNHLHGGKCPRKTSFPIFIQPVWGFLREKLQNSIRYPISHRKGYIHFCHPTPPSLKKCHVPVKFFFTVILENIVFFEKIVK